MQTQKDQILELLHNKPKHAARMIANNLKMLQWVDANCDSKCQDLAAKIHTALFDTKIACPCGSNKPRKLKSILEGFRFCGKASTCIAAKHAVSTSCKEAHKHVDKKLAQQRRENTNFQQTGYKNSGQTLKAKTNHRAYYNALPKNPKKEKIGVLANAYNKLFKEFLNAGYTWLDDVAQYIGVNQKQAIKYNFKHDCGFEFTTYIYSGNRPVCEKCFPKQPKWTSNAENELAEWIKTVTQNTVLTSNKSIINPYELDIVVVENKLAIEYCGLYWHSEYSNGKNPNYHKNKQKLAADKGYVLITIFEDEWINHKDICKNLILNALNTTAATKIAARKCTVKQVANKDLREFLDNNHLQGWANASNSYGLYFNDELVQCMTFGKPRYSKVTELELIRLCTKINTQIIGGTQKLWKAAIAELNPNSISSYCDRRWFTGNIYAALGFNLLREGSPTYWYTDYKTRFHRSKFTKKQLVFMGFDINKTEKEIAHKNLKLDRIWDCGQDSWIWHKI